MWVVRAIGSSGGTNTNASVALTTLGAPSAGSLSSASNAFPVALVAGETFLHKVDGGSAVTATVTATRAYKTGSGATYVAPVSGHALVLTISDDVGSETQTITFTTENSQALYHATINAALVRGRAVNSGGETEIESDQLGSGVTISISASSSAGVLTILGLTSGAGTAGTGNVANVGAVTAAELAAIFEAAYTGTTSTASGTQLTIASDTTGASSSVQFSSGTGVSKISGFDNAVHSGAANAAVTIMTATAVGPGSDYNAYAIKPTLVETRLGTLTTTQASGTITSLVMPTTITSRLAPGDTVRLYDSTTSTTARGIVKTIKNGTVTFVSSVVLSGNLTSGNAQVVLEVFSLSVYRDGNLVQGPFTNLRLSSLSAKNYFLTRLNTGNKENLFTFTDAGASGSNLDLRPSTSSATGFQLASGDEATTFSDADYIGDTSTKTGIQAFSNALGASPLRMLAAPGITGTTAGAISKALLAFCSSTEKVWGLISAPVGTARDTAVTYKANNLDGTSYGSMYWPWVKVISSVSGQPELLPPEALAMGRAAWTDRNLGVQHAPAGDQAGALANVVGLEFEVNDDDADILYPENINTIQMIPGVGPAIYGSRTLENGEYNQIHVRRTMIYLRESIRVGTRYVIFEENTSATRARVSRSLTEFFEREWRKGTLTADSATEAYSVKCDEENNPDVVITAQQMVADCGVNIPNTVENLLINISNSTAPGGRQA